MTKKKQSHQIPEIPKVRSFETFREINQWQENELTQIQPSCVNFLRVKKYRITVEEIDEPDEVICQRLQELWDNTTNWHHADRLITAAQKYGYKLVGAMGNNVKNRTQNTSP